MKNYCFLLCFVILGCTTSSQVNLGPSGDNVYISNGVEQYFLPQLPHWANFSIEGQCFRKNHIRYLDFEKMSQSYDLDYFQLVNMQHMLNRTLYAYKSSSGQDRLSPRDESFIFSNTYQKIADGASDFIMPKYSDISLIDVDKIILQKNKLKKVLQKRRVQMGYPILVSRCYTSYELEETVQRLGLETQGLKYISAEMFSIYGKNLKKAPGYKIDLKTFFKDKTLTLFKVNETQSKKIEGVTIKEIKI